MHYIIQLHDPRWRPLKQKLKKFTWRTSPEFGSHRHFKVYACAVNTSQFPCSCKWPHSILIQLWWFVQHFSPLRGESEVLLVLLSSLLVHPSPELLEGEAARKEGALWKTHSVTWVLQKQLRGLSWETQPGTLWFLRLMNFFRIRTGKQLEMS